MRNDLHTATQWITSAALEHGAGDLPAVVMQRLDVGRRAASALLERLVAAQWLVRDGTLRRPVYRPGALRQVVQQLPLAGLQDDLVWRRSFAPAFCLPPAVERMVQHAFCELLDNAASHSRGSTVTVSLRQTALHVQLLVSDDGCGVFSRIAEAFGIDDPRLALLDLGKGKLTSDPARHAGHGLFFTARLADVFDLHANAQAFRHGGGVHGRWRATRALPRQGTSIYLAIALDTGRTLDTVLRAHSAAGDGYAFDRTQLAAGLLTDAGGGIASRIQARRLTARLQQFRHAEIDFSDVAHIGHGFADELFRVQANAHPGVTLVPVGMQPQVAAMVAAVRGAGGQPTRPTLSMLVPPG